MLEFLRSEVKGVIYQNSVLDEIKLGGRSYPRSGKYLIEIDEPQIDELYLTMVSVLSEPVSKVMWRVSVDGLNITREFKPQIANESPIGNIYAVHVFDLSKIVKGGKTYTLTISCDSSMPVIVDGLELVGVRRVDGVSTGVSYRAGCVLLNPSESYSIRSTFSKPGLYNASLFMNVPSRNALVDISLNDEHVRTLSGLLGLSNVQLSNLRLKGKDTLVIRHRETAEMYHPRFIGVYSVLKHDVNCRGPEVTMTLDEVLCEGKECKLSVVLKNEGDIACDNVMVVGFSAGNILLRDVISSIKVGEEVRKRYCVNVKGVDNRVVLKVIYRRFGRQIINEVKTSLPAVT